MSTPEDRKEKANAAMGSTHNKRQYVYLAVLVLVVLGILAYPIYKTVTGEEKTQPGTPTGAAPVDAGVQEDIFKDAEGGADHRPIDEAIEYADNPPAFGPHWPTWATLERKFYTTDRPNVEYLVHNLEHGYTILWYDETIAEDETQLEQIQQYANSFSTTDYSGKFIAVPWTSEDGEAFPEGAHFALTRWLGTEKEQQQGVWRYFDTFSSEVVDDFMETYPYTDSPEPNAP